MNTYGKELIMDLHECDPSLFTRQHISRFFSELCKLVDMEPEDRYFWDDQDTPEEEKQTEPHTKGTTAVQFILTSNITIHTLDLKKAVYVNLFSCKDFNVNAAADFISSFFRGTIENLQEVDRL